jgi:hypothetical protein
VNKRKQASRGYLRRPPSPPFRISRAGKSTRGHEDTTCSTWQPMGKVALVCVIWLSHSRPFRQHCRKARPFPLVGTCHGSSMLQLRRNGGVEYESLLVAAPTLPANARLALKEKGQLLLGLAAQTNQVIDFFECLGGIVLCLVVGCVMVIGIHFVCCRVWIVKGTCCPMILVCVLELSLRAGAATQGCPRKQ